MRLSDRKCISSVITHDGFEELTVDRKISKYNENKLFQFFVSNFVFFDLIHANRNDSPKRNFPSGRYDEFFKGE